MSQEPTPPQSPDEKRWYSHFVTPKNLVVTTTLIITIILMNWRVPTRVQMALTVDRAEFTVGSTSSTRILDAVPFHSLHLENFQTLSFHPQVLEVADPRQYDLQADRFPPSAWRPLPTQGTVTIQPKAHQASSSITFEQPGKEEPSSSRLDPIWVSQGSVVVFERAGFQANTITVQAEGSSNRATLTFSGTIDMVLDAGELMGIMGKPPFPDQESLTYRVRLSSSNPSIEIIGNDQSLTLTITSDEGAFQHLFSQDAIPVTQLEFSHQNEVGNRASALVTTTTISYPDFPDIPPASIEPPDFIGLSDLQAFHIKTVQWNPAQPGFHMVLDGIAGHIRSGVEDMPLDHRLTKFDTLWHNPRIHQLLKIGKEVAG